MLTGIDIYGLARGRSVERYAPVHIFREFSVPVLPSAQAWLCQSILMTIVHGKAVKFISSESLKIHRIAKHDMLRAFHLVVLFRMSSFRFLMKLAVFLIENQISSIVSQIFLRNIFGKDLQAL